MTGYCAGLLLIQADIRIWMTTESPYRELSVAASFLITFWVHNIFFGKLGVAQPHCIVHILSNPLFIGARIGLPGFGPGQAHIKKLAKRLGGALSQVRQREKERERERDRERERRTHRQTDRRTNRHTDRQRETEMET